MDAGDDDGFDMRWYGALIPREHWHFHRQLLKRYGLVLAPGAFTRMLRALEDGTAMLVEHRRQQAAIYCLRVMGERIYLLLDKRRRVISAWPPEKRLNRLRRELLQITA